MDAADRIPLPGSCRSEERPGGTGRKAQRGARGRGTEADRDPLARPVPAPPSRPLLGAPGAASAAAQQRPSPWPWSCCNPQKLVFVQHRGCRCPGAGGNRRPEPSLPAPTPHGSPEGPRISRLSSRLCPVAFAELRGAPRPRVGVQSREAAVPAASRAGVSAGIASSSRCNPRGTHAEPGLRPRLRCGGGRDEARRKRERHRESSAERPPPRGNRPEPPRVGEPGPGLRPLVGVLVRKEKRDGAVPAPWPEAVAGGTVRGSAGQFLPLPEGVRGPPRPGPAALRGPPCQAGPMEAAAEPGHGPPSGLPRSAAGAAWAPHGLLAEGAARPRVSTAHADSGPVSGSRARCRLGDSFGPARTYEFLGAQRAAAARSSRPPPRFSLCGIFHGHEFCNETGVQQPLPVSRVGRWSEHACPSAAEPGAAGRTWLQPNTGTIDSRTGAGHSPAPPVHCSDRASEAAPSHGHPRRVDPAQLPTRFPGWPRMPVLLVYPFMPRSRSSVSTTLLLGEPSTDPTVGPPGGTGAEQVARWQSPRACPSRNRPRDRSGPRDPGKASCSPGTDGQRIARPGAPFHASSLNAWIPPRTLGAAGLGFPVSPAARFGSGCFPPGPRDVAFSFPSISGIIGEAETGSQLRHQHPKVPLGMLPGSAEVFGIEFVIGRDFPGGSGGEVETGGSVPRWADPWHGRCPFPGHRRGLAGP
ncbi:collagen alpha-1(I) chain-like [Neopelma chrysocephalum]|uniref:collagen alpha-1(I) chain-like n=1 Tax=Neopelma chrysocephalum TaxID=114329 RepID=UPI000FCD24B5|nr:collagen alpha-1(I) chain-like [Neopelma chrysocephalum]